MDSVSRWIRPVIRALLLIGLFSMAVSSHAYAPYAANFHVHTDISRSIPIPFVSWGDNWTALSPLETVERQHCVGLDVIGLSDHDTLDHPIIDSDWSYLLWLSDESQRSPNPYACTLRGFEWTYCGVGGQSSTYDHINVFETSSLSHADSSRPIDDEIVSLYSFLKNASTTDGGAPIAQFNHIWMGTQFNVFSHWDSHIDKVFCLAEIGGAADPKLELGLYHPASESEYCLKTALIKGWHVAPSIGRDNFFPLDDNARIHHTGVQSSGPDRASILEAIRARRLFASEDKNFELQYWCNIDGGPDKLMGSRCPIPYGKSIKFSFLAHDPDSDEQGVAAIDLVSPTYGDEFHMPYADNIVQSVTFGFGAFMDIGQTYLGERCLYLRIKQADGDYIYSAPIWITGVQYPDLQIESVSYSPSTLQANVPVTVTAVVRNNGAISTDVGSTTRWSSSNCPIGVNSDGSYKYPSKDWATPALAPGAAATLTYAFTPIRGGDFGYQSWCDATNAVIEGNGEDNNSCSGRFSVQSPDLIVQSRGVSLPTKVDSPATVTVVAKNQGGAPTFGVSTTRWQSDVPIGANSDGSYIYPSADLATAKLSAGKTATVSTSFTPIRGGSFRDNAQADVHDTSHEERHCYYDWGDEYWDWAAEYNDGYSNIFKVDSPDIIVSNVSYSSPCQMDSPVTVTVSVKNQGNAPSTHSFVVRFDTDCPVRANPDGSFVHPGNTWTVDTLAAGETKLLTYTYTPVRGGVFNHTVQTDVNNEVHEERYVAGDSLWTGYWDWSPENNNVLSASYTVNAPDLVVQSVDTGTAPMLANSPLKVTVVIKNQGTAPTTHPIVTRWSATCPVVSTNSGQFGTATHDWVTQQILAGQTATLTYTCTPVRGGSFTQSVQVDQYNDMHEELYTASRYWDYGPENNNSLSSALALENPDLVVQSISYTPAQLQANLPVTVTVVVKNQGKAPATNAFTTIWASSHCPVGGTDSSSYVYASKEWTVSQLGPGQTSSLAYTFTPIRGGEFPAEAQVDTKNTVHEELVNVNDAAEQNNVMRGMFDIDAPDLVADSTVYSPALLEANRPVTVTVSVKNQGKAASLVPSVVRWSSGNCPIGTNSNGSFVYPSSEWTVGPLNAGASVLQTITFTPTIGGHFSADTIVDATNTVREERGVSSDQWNFVPENNTFSKSIVVESPDLVVQSVQCTESATNPKTITVVVVTKNQGTAGNTTPIITRWISGDCPVAVTADGSFTYAAKEWSTGTLAAGRITTLTYSFTPIRSGKYSFVATADSTNTVHEETRYYYDNLDFGKEQNNTSSGTFDSTQSLSSVSLSVNPASPRPVYTPIVLVGNAQGGSKIVYQFKVGNTIVRSYGSSPQCQWYPTTPGTYNLVVSAKDLSVTPSQEISSTVRSYTITSQISDVALTIKPTSPSTVNTAITVTAVATGGASRVYRFMVNGIVQQNYSSKSSFMWNPVLSGTYYLSVSARDVNASNSAAEVSSNPVAYVITPKITSVSLIAAPAPVSKTNAPVVLTAVAINGANLQYQFLADDGSGYMTLGSYQSSNRLLWKPTRAGMYKLKVYAREAGSSQTYDVTSCDVVQSVVDYVGTRKFPSKTYAPGQPEVLTIALTPISGTQKYSVEEIPPIGWAVSGISHGGIFDESTGRIKWGPFSDTQSRTLSYSALPPIDEGQVVQFEGVVMLGDSEEPIDGDSLQSAGFFHPADLNDDYHISVGELTAYGMAWKSSKYWGRAPYPIPINYVTNAGLLWKQGEIYHYDSALNPPYASGKGVQQSFVYNALLADMSSTRDGVQRALGCTAVAKCSRLRYIRGVSMQMSILVTPMVGVSVYAVEDCIPVGWSVSSISDGGRFDRTTRSVKWGPFFDSKIRRLTYIIIPPVNASGMTTFAGVASVDGLSNNVTGDRRLLR